MADDTTLYRLKKLLLTEVKDVPRKLAISRACCCGCPPGCSVTNSYSHCNKLGVNIWVAKNCTGLGKCGFYIESKPFPSCPLGIRWYGYCCEYGCDPCTKNESCTDGFLGCLEDDWTPGGIVRNGWYETYVDAKAAGVADGKVWCGDGVCCPDDYPCFVVGCDEDSDYNTHIDCRKYFWKLCCPCCDSCGEYELPPILPEGCERCEEDDARDACKVGGLPGGANLPVGTIPPNCHVAGNCAAGVCGAPEIDNCEVNKVGPGYCTAALATDGAVAAIGPHPCDETNCDLALGCYYITCDPDKCKDRFNWVGCGCRGSCDDCEDGETCTDDDIGCMEQDGDPVRNGWYETYALAKAAAEAAEIPPHVHCDGGCCPGGKPCFIVGCDEESEHNVPGDCKKYFWQLCCDCCEDCGSYPAPPTFPPGCEPGEDGIVPPGCLVEGACAPFGGDCTPNVCTVERVGPGFCTAVAAAYDAVLPPNSLLPCRDFEPFRCDDGCYYITCDPDKCEDKFNWVECKCRGCSCDGYPATGSVSCGTSTFGCGTGGGSTTLCADDTSGGPFPTPEEAIADAEDKTDFSKVCTSTNCDCYYITCEKVDDVCNFSWNSCACPAGCPDCEFGETCTSYGCEDSDIHDRNGWYETWQGAKDAGEVDNTWCGDPGVDCCDGAAPCFIIGCDEESEHNTPSDCKKYFWQLCCDCCPGGPDDCPAPPAPSCVNEDDDDLCAADCEEGEEMGEGYCTVAAATAAAVAAGHSACTGTNCVDPGCYIITCDGTKCDNRFNWVLCICAGAACSCAGYPETGHVFCGDSTFDCISGYPCNTYLTGGPFTSATAAIADAKAKTGFSTVCSGTNCECYFITCKKVDDVCSFHWKSCKCPPS